MERNTFLLRNLNKTPLVKQIHWEVPHSRHLLWKTDIYENQLFLKKNQKTRPEKPKQTNKNLPQTYSHRKPSQVKKLVKLKCYLFCLFHNVLPAPEPCFEHDIKSHRGRKKFKNFCAWYNRTFGPLLPTSPKQSSS